MQTRWLKRSNHFAIMAQTRRGIASGKVRRFATYDRDRFIAARLDAGESYRTVARAFGVHYSTVARTRDRLKRRRRGPLGVART